MCAQNSSPVWRVYACEKADVLGYMNGSPRYPLGPSGDKAMQDGRHTPA